MKLRKLWPLVGALCATAFGSAFAHSNYQQSGSNGGSSTYGSGMDSSSSKQQGQQGTYQRGTFREITPNAGPRVANGADVFITADFIYWKAVQEGVSAPFTGVGTDVAKGRVLDFANSWEPGFKVALGLNLSHGGWDTVVEYTWLRPSGSGAINRTDGVGFSGDSNVSGDRGTGSWTQSFNVIDWELGRNFYLSQYLTMRPFIGLKGTWQDQTTTVNVRNVDGDTLVDRFTSKNDFDVWGIGVRGGFDIAWYFAKNWSIYGDLAWTNLWTEYSSDTRKDSTFVAATNVTTTSVNVSNNSHYTVKQVFESEIGLRWEMWFYDDNYHFAIQAGWEQQTWINFGLTDLTVNPTFADFNLHGLNLKFRLDF